MPESHDGEYRSNIFDYPQACRDLFGLETVSDAGQSG
jgi:hypothetical protein